MWSRVFCCTLAHSFALESLDLSLEIWSSGLESIGNFSGSSEFRLEEEGCWVQCIGEKMTHHSVLIYDSNMDNMMTLCRLRRPSGRPPDYI